MWQHFIRKNNKNEREREREIQRNSTVNNENYKKVIINDHFKLKNILKFYGFK